MGTEHHFDHMDALCSHFWLFPVHREYVINSLCKGEMSQGWKARRNFIV